MQQSQEHIRQLFLHFYKLGHNVNEAKRKMCQSWDQKSIGHIPLTSVPGTKVDNLKKRMLSIWWCVKDVIWWEMLPGKATINTMRQRQ